MYAIIEIHMTVVDIAKFGTLFSYCGYPHFLIRACMMSSMPIGNTFDVLKCFKIPHS